MQYLVNEDPKGILKTVKCFALDMDGTIYIGDELIEGAAAFIQKLRETNRRFVFLTNNSSKSASVYVEKLNRLGLCIGRDEILTSGTATIGYLRREYPHKRVFLLGTAALRAEFEAEGIPLDDENPQLVVAAYDTSLDYARLCAVCDFVRMGLPYIATHPDLNCPAASKTGAVPDLGAFMALIEASTGRKADIIIGKPNVEIVRAVAAHTGCALHEMAIVGDRLYTDIAMGAAHNLTSVLVLSGETKREHLECSAVHPDLVFDSLLYMIDYLG